MQTPERRRLTSAEEALVAEFARDLDREVDPRPPAGQLQVWERMVRALPEGSGRVLATRLLAELRLERSRRGGSDG